MPQSKRLTNDQGERLQLKSRLNEKLRGVMTPPAFAATEPELLLLPTGYEEMSDAVLSFTLIHNPELKHSAESATFTINMLKGAIPRSVNVKFQTIELANPVPVPEIVAEKPLQRKASKPAPGFASTKDSTPERAAKEDLKKNQFKQSLADKIQDVLTHPGVVKVPGARILLLPHNYEELSDADLHFALVNLRELKHSHDSALLAIEILKGRVAPKDVVLQTSETRFEVEGPVAAKPVRQPITVARARDAAVFGTHVPKLPLNYQELSEVELGYTLLHTADFRYTPEAVADILDVLFSRRDALPQPKIKVEAPPTPPEHEFGTVLKLPVNYKELTALELNDALLKLPELEHTAETASLAMKILQGMQIPNDTALRTVDVKAEKHFTSAPVKRTVRTREATKPLDVTSSEIEGEGSMVLLLPEGYQDLTEAALFSAFANEARYKQTPETAALTMDVLFRRIPQPQGVTFQVVDELIDE